MAKEMMEEMEAPEGMGFGPEVAEAEQLDEEMFSQVSPKGQFSSKALNGLVKASNKLLPVFDQEGNYPEFSPGSYEVFPNEFVRVLTMFSNASRDAAAEDVISPELVVSLDGINNDNGVQVLTGKVDMLAKNKDFKKWLKEPQPESVEPMGEEPEGSEELSEEDMDALFMNRL